MWLELMGISCTNTHCTHIQLSFLHSLSLHHLEYSVSYFTLDTLKKSATDHATSQAKGMPFDSFHSISISIADIRVTRINISAESVPIMPPMHIPQQGRIRHRVISKS